MKPRAVSVTRHFSRPGRRRVFPSAEPLEGRRLLATLFVDAGNTTGVEDGSREHPYRLIQAAIDGSASAGDTVRIAPGTYAEALNVDRPVRLAGPNEGIDPNTGSRGAEAVIIPPVNNPNSGRDVVVTADYVTIDGLTIDGHNPDLSAGTPLNGVSSNAASGVSNVNAAGDLARISGLTVRNDVIRNFTEFGVIGDANDFQARTLFVSDGNTIAHNRIDNVPLVAPVPGRGISLEDNFYADVTDNVITRAGTGIQVIFALSAGEAATPYQVSRNEVHEYALGIYFWNIDTGTAAYNVADNRVSAEAGASPADTGIELRTVLHDTTIGLSNDSVTGAHTGLKIDYDTATLPVTVSGGTFSGDAVGVELSYASTPGGETAHHPVQAALQGVTVTASSSAGLAVTDALSVAAAPVTLTLDAATAVTGAARGEAISGPNARLVESVSPVVAFTAARSSGSAAAFAFTATDNLTTPNDLVTTYRLDGGPVTAATSPLNLAGLSSGPHTLTLSARDQAGNAGSAIYEWSVAGVTPPVAPPSAPRLAPGSDSGVSASDGVTNVRTPGFVGTAVPGSVVTLRAGNATLGSTTATASGAWSFTAASPLADGAYVVTASAAVGTTVSAPSAPLRITIDATPPVIRTSASSRPNGSGWYRGPVTVGFSAIDALSGLVSPATGSFAFRASGAGQTHTFAVTDRAGNTAVVKLGPVNIDAVGPAVTASALLPVRRGGAAAVVVSGRIIDAASGIASGSYVVKDALGRVVAAGLIKPGAGGGYAVALSLPNGARVGRPRPYLITVTGKDKAGDIRSLSTTVTV